MAQKDLRELLYPELEEEFLAMGEKSFRAQQVYGWVYQKNSLSFSQMKNLPQELRAKLAQHFLLNPFPIQEKQISHDGTTKFLFTLDDHQKIETVLIPTGKRTTACLSTQVGCKFGCCFCASGVGGWIRNLSAAEIVTQVLHVKEEAQEHSNPLSHIVFMGGGEPLDNFDNVMKAIRILNDPRGLNIGARRITVSTCGVIPGIKKLALEGIQIELAISLHGYDNASRNLLMPVNRKYPFDDLMDACRAYVQKTNRQITFEYILIEDVTCTKDAVLALKKAFRGIICKMNLIPYNPVSEFDLKAPSLKEIRAFQGLLKDADIHSTLRSTRGQDIKGACGQLRNV